MNDEDQMAPLYSPVQAFVCSIFLTFTGALYFLIENYRGMGHKRKADQCKRVSWYCIWVVAFSYAYVSVIQEGNTLLLMMGINLFFGGVTAFWIDRKQWKPLSRAELLRHGAQSSLKALKVGLVGMLVFLMAIMGPLALMLIFNTVSNTL